jgi:hypothetical protein
VRFQASHYPLQKPDQVTLGAAQFTAQSPERGRCLIAHRAIGIDGSIYRFLRLPSDDQTLCVTTKEPQRAVVAVFPLPLEHLARQAR